MYEVVRKAGSVQWHHELESWICTTYSECKAALSAPDVFTTDPERVGAEVPPERRSIQTLDPPRYSEPRQALAQEFRAINLDAVVRLARLEAQTQVDAYRRGEAPLVQAVGTFALRTVSAVLGIEGIDESEFVRLSETLVRGMDYGFRPESGQPADDARAEISRMLDRLASSDRLRGLAHNFLRSSGAADRNFALNSLRVLLHAGYSSSCRLIENSIALIAKHEDLQPRLSLATASEWKAAVNEFVRFDGPVQAEARIVAQEVTFGGAELLRGDVIILVLGSANTDPDQFWQPELVDLTRQPNAHLGFGRGIHSCLGAATATIQTQTFLRALLEAGELSLSSEPVRRDNATLRGCAELPVVIRNHRTHGPTRD